MSYIMAYGKIVDVTGKRIVSSYYGLKPDEIYVGCEYRQADKIEELADFICYKIKKGGLVVVKLTKDFPMDALRKAKGMGEIEYARLMNVVGKDLKCVAEMNEKGEFELI